MPSSAQQRQLQHRDRARCRTLGSAAISEDDAARPPRRALLLLTMETGPGGDSPYLVLAWSALEERR